MLVPNLLFNARLPLWLLPLQWPAAEDGPALATLELSGGRIVGLRPSDATRFADTGAWDLAGCLVLPGLVDAHTHLDKAFIRHRIPRQQPGLLGAIEATQADRPHWTADDLHKRAEKGLQWAWEYGTTHMRTHVEWGTGEDAPTAWDVTRELARRWAGRMRLEQVALVRLPMFEDPVRARRIAHAVAATGPGALLGGFVHSANWSENALRNLLLAAQAFDLDIDLHVDEELNAAACGLATTARIVREIGFEGRVVCGHACALAAQDERVAQQTLDAVAAAGITLVSLPATNLLLQDAQHGRTPRRRGITLVKEAHARGIPVLFASDNVQDPFCALGSFDPLDAMSAATLAAQLGQPFDRWSETLCRHEWLRRGPSPAPRLVGEPADLVLFPLADAHSWPSRGGDRIVVRGGRIVRGAVPSSWSRHPGARSFH